jgi:hypothetical protein
MDDLQTIRKQAGIDAIRSFAERWKWAQDQLSLHKGTDGTNDPPQVVEYRGEMRAFEEATSCIQKFSQSRTRKLLFGANI